MKSNKKTTLSGFSCLQTQYFFRRARIKVEAVRMTGNMFNRFKKFIQLDVSANYCANIYIFAVTLVTLS